MNQRQFKAFYRTNMPEVKEWTSVILGALAIMVLLFEIYLITYLI